MPGDNTFRVVVYSKPRYHPLTIAASVSGETMVDMKAASKGLISESNFHPPIRKIKVIFSDLITVDKAHTEYQNLPDYVCLKLKRTPGEVRNARNTLWKKVNDEETRENSQFARSFELRLPTGLDQQRAINLLTSFSREVLAEAGMIVDCSIHESIGRSTPRRMAYILATMRKCHRKEFGNKARKWNLTPTMTEWRKQWFSRLRTEINEQLLSDTQFATAETFNWLLVADRFAPRTPPKEPTGTPLTDGEDPFFITDTAVPNLDEITPVPPSPAPARRPRL